MIKGCRIVLSACMPGTLFLIFALKKLTSRGKFLSASGVRKIYQKNFFSNENLRRKIVQPYHRWEIYLF